MNKKEENKMEKSYQWICTYKNGYGEKVVCRTQDYYTESEIKDRMPDCDSYVKIEEDYKEDNRYLVSTEIGDLDLNLLEGKQFHFNKKELQYLLKHCIIEDIYLTIEAYRPTKYITCVNCKHEMEKNVKKEIRISLDGEITSVPPELLE